MKNIFLTSVEEIAFLIGLVGVLVIIVGVCRGLLHYMIHLKEDNFRNIRYEIGSHLILGLDFLVAKDIIDTLLLDAYNTEAFWIDLTILITVVTIRITLTFSIQKELIQLKHWDEEYRRPSKNKKD